MSYNSHIAMLQMMMDFEIENCEGECSNGEIKCECCTRADELRDRCKEAYSLETQLKASQARTALVENKYRNLRARSDDQIEGFKADAERLKYNLEVSTGLNADLRLEVERLKGCIEWGEYEYKKLFKYGDACNVDQAYGMRKLLDKLNEAPK